MGLPFLQVFWSGGRGYMPKPNSNPNLNLCKTMLMPNPNRNDVFVMLLPSPKALPLQQSRMGVAKEAVFSEWLTSNPYPCYVSGLLT